MKGKLIIVGIGPGGIEHMTPRAKDAIVYCDIVAGYTHYIGYISEIVTGKEIISTGMRAEVDRGKRAVESARSGKQVCVVSSGDPGVYGMAGLIIELLTDEDRRSIDIEVIPGVTSATASASILGAPLMHDFCIISLSDLLTDIDLIVSRIEHACDGDFVIAIYNPRGTRRTGPFRMLCTVLSEKKAPDTPVGIVKDACRNGESARITTVRELSGYEQDIDMKTTVIIGNSKTRTIGDLMVTPRGYRLDD